MEELRSSLEDYLSGAITGGLIVDIVDEMVSSDIVYDLPKLEQDIVLKYQDTLAYYVEEDFKRSESPSYFGPEELRVVISDFIGELKSLKDG